MATSDTVAIIVDDELRRGVGHVNMSLRLAAVAESTDEPEGQ